MYLDSVEHSGNDRPLFVFFLVPCYLDLEARECARGVLLLFRHSRNLKESGFKYMDPGLKIAGVTNKKEASV